MLAIRLQRLGRKALPVYRLAVQESRRHPSSGRVVAYVGNYNPHTKDASIQKDKVEFYLKNGAQPTPRVVRLLQQQKVELPAWVKSGSGKKTGAVRNPDKLRKHSPADETAAAKQSSEESSGELESESSDTSEVPAKE